MDDFYFNSIDSSLKEEMMLVECRLPISNGNKIDVVSKNLGVFDRVLLKVKVVIKLFYKCFYFYMYPLTVYIYIDLLKK